MVRLRLFALAVALIITGGCGKRSTPPSSAAPAPHEHTPPHGGTAVVLGKEAFHLELVRDAATGTLQAYILDGEMENFVRIALPSLDVAATTPDGENRSLVLTAIANPATGETIGDSALFVAQAEWLKSIPTFDAVLKTISVRGTTFSDVKFSFPNGNEATAR